MSVMTYDKNTDYQALIEEALQAGDYRSAALFEQQQEQTAADMEQRNANASTAQTANIGYVDSSGSTQNTNVTEDLRKYFYDASGDAAYQQALQALQQAQNSKPSYAGTYDPQLQEIYDKIVNRDKFQYDLNGDMLYQQYKDNYVNLGKMSMKDTMGQAAALTGGYGSSYGQSVGQQQYDAYLQQLNDVVPELYGMALDQYNAEGDRMLQQYNMVADMRDDEYGKYQDALSQYWANVDYLQGQADNAYDRSYNNWINAYQMQQEAEEKEYDRAREEYDRLAELISTTGYEPTWIETFVAGMSPQQVLAYQTYYKNNMASKSTTSSSGSSGGSTGSGSNATTIDLAALAASGTGPTNNKFTGSTYSEAVAFMKRNGVDAISASSIMTENEWRRRKASYNSTGIGSVEVVNYNSYKEYLADIVEYYVG